MSGVLERLAHDLKEARVEHTLLDPADYSSISAARCPDERAYELQKRVVSAACQGDSHRGWKIALSNQPAQTAFNTSEPAYGILCDSMRLHSGSIVLLGNYHKPKLEIEPAFVAADDFSVEQVARLTAEQLFSGVAPAVEIASSRYRNWTRNWFLFVADNSASGGYCVGDVQPLNSSNLQQQYCSVSVNDEPEIQGGSGAIDGGPKGVLSWFLEKLRNQRVGLQKGQIVMVGSLIKPIDLKAGDRVKASYLGQEFSFQFE